MGIPGIAPEFTAAQGDCRAGKMWSGQQEFLSAAGIGKQIPNPQKHREKILIPGSLAANRSDPSCSHGIIPNTVLGAGKSQDVAPKGSARAPKHKAKGKLILNLI